MRTQEFLDELEALYVDPAIGHLYSQGWNECLDEVIARAESM